MWACEARRCEWTPQAHQTSASAQTAVPPSLRCVRDLAWAYSAAGAVARALPARRATRARPAAAGPMTHYSAFTQFDFYEQTTAEQFDTPPQFTQAFACLVCSQEESKCVLCAQHKHVWAELGLPQRQQLVGLARSIGEARRGGKAAAKQQFTAYAAALKPVFQAAARNAAAKRLADNMAVAASAVAAQAVAYEANVRACEAAAESMCAYAGAHTPVSAHPVKLCGPPAFFLTHAWCVQRVTAHLCWAARRRRHRSGQRCPRRLFRWRYSCSSPRWHGRARQRWLQRSSLSNHSM